MESAGWAADEGVIITLRHPCATCGKEYRGDVEIPGPPSVVVDAAGASAASVRLAPRDAAALMRMQEAHDAVVAELERQASECRHGLAVANTPGAAT